MVSVLSRQQQKGHDRFDELRKRQLKPPEYCQEWVPKLWGVQTGERGYRKACISELARVTGYEKNTINTWGKDLGEYPQDAAKKVETALAREHLLNQIREKVALPPEIFED